MTEPINVVALLKVNVEKIEALEPYVKNIANKSRLEEGVVRYEVYRVKEMKGVYIFLEQYKDQQAREYHRSTEHFI
jgi:quinol monooxygenase YgiN